MRLKWLVVLGALASLPALAQVECRMPSGVVITMRLSNCPSDAVQIGGTPAPTAAVKAPVAPIPSEQPERERGWLMALVEWGIVGAVLYWLVSRLRRGRRMADRSRPTKDSRRYILRYLREDGILTERKVSSLVGMNDRQFSAYCHARQEERTFNFARVVTFVSVVNGKRLTPPQLYSRLFPRQGLPLEIERYREFRLGITLRLVARASSGVIKQGDRAVIRNAIAELSGQEVAMTVVDPIMRVQVPGGNPFWWAKLLDDDTREIGLRAARILVKPTARHGVDAEALEAVENMFSEPVAVLAEKVSASNT